ncbi:MAG: chemotaxis protein CheA [Myxococcales bacterium]|nr:chemotaxis protein CheA [Myxococcales bacterium]
MDDYGTRAGRLPLVSQSEFVAEVQELIETFSRRLTEIEGQIKTGNESDPEALNGAFRSVHTIKSLAGMLGADVFVDFTHKLEETLDALRLGKLPLDPKTLDLLFEAVDLSERLLEQAVGTKVEPVDPSSFLERLKRLAGADVDVGPAPLPWLDESILAVLTEFEEYRLRENVRLGRRLYRVHSSFDLLTIDVGIDALKRELKRYGEVITYLPRAESSDDDHIDLDIIVASTEGIRELAAGIGEGGVSIEALESGEKVLLTPGGAGAGAAPEGADVVEKIPGPAPVEDVVPPVVSPVVPPVVEKPTPPAPPAEELLKLDENLTQTVRIDLRHLDLLMNLVGELALVQANLEGLIERLRRARAAGAFSDSNEFMREIHEHLRVMNRRLGMLQNSILDVRMVPLGHMFEGLKRSVRKDVKELGKDIEVTISGSETELDKRIVEGLHSPLMHLIRNAIDHGIEAPAARVAAGKPRSGRVVLSARQQGNRVVIEVIDDGKGMDWRQIRDKAVAKQVIGPGEAAMLGPAQAINLIFTPGFSTRDEATKLSGRGYGMDVVKTEIAKLSGMIDVASEPGRGSRFRITLPTTLAIVQALVIEAGAQTFCVSLNSVLESVMVQRSDIQTIEGHEVVEVRGRTLPLIHLSRVFELEPKGREAERRMFYDRLYVVVVGLAQHRVGLVVDELLGQQDVVIKPIGKALRQVPGIAGATELGDNRTVLLLDVATLVSEAVGGVEAAVAGL